VLDCTHRDLLKPDVKKLYFTSPASQFLEELTTLTFSLFFLVESDVIGMNIEETRVRDKDTK
jgi:hypothetical protein